MLAKVEGPQKDVEAQEVGKHEPYILRQPQMISVDDLRQHIRRAIRRGHLIRWHAAEERIRPTASLTRLLKIFDTFLSCSTPCRGIMTIENTTLDVGREEIGKSQDGKQQHCQHIRQAFL